MRMPTVYILACGTNAGSANETHGTPMSLSPISGKPFLRWQLLWLAAQDVRDVVILAEEGLEKVRSYITRCTIPDVHIRCLDPGEIAEKFRDGSAVGECVIMSGDILFDIPLAWLVEYRRVHLPRESVCLALRYFEDVEKSGWLSLGSSWEVSKFQEKKESRNEGYVSGGIYIADSNLLKGRDSFGITMVRETFPDLISKTKLFGIPFGGKYFGLGAEKCKLPGDCSIEEWFFGRKSPALFLDRDGILVEDSGYLKDPESLVFNERFFELSRTAQDKGFVVAVLSNQAGVAKGIISVEDVEKINHRIRKEFAGYGVNPAGIYWCPYHDEGIVPEWRRASLLRKPEPAMALKAMEEHALDPLASIMIGDKDTDRIRLPYLRTYIVPGRYPVEDMGDVVDFRYIENIIESYGNSVD